VLIVVFSANAFWTALNTNSYVDDTWVIAFFSVSSIGPPGCPEIRAFKWVCCCYCALFWWLKNSQIQASAHSISLISNYVFEMSTDELMNEMEHYVVQNKNYLERANCWSARHHILLACELTYWCSRIRSSAFCLLIRSVSSMSFARDCSTSL